MFGNISFTNSHQKSMNDLSSTFLIKKIENTFDMRRFHTGDTAIYIVLPDEDRQMYTEDTKKELAKVLTRAFKSKEITSKLITKLVFIIEYSIKKNTVTNYFPIDKELVDNIPEISKYLHESRIIELTL